MKSTATPKQDISKKALIRQHKVKGPQGPRETSPPLNISARPDANRSSLQLPLLKPTVDL